MHQIKLFKNVETELGTLENDVNRWLRESKAKVISIEANIAPQTMGRDAGMQTGGGRIFSASDILVAVLYEADAG